MIDDEEQNVDDVRPIKLDTIIPNKISKKKFLSNFYYDFPIH